MKIKKKEIIRLLKFMLCNQTAWLFDVGVFTLLYEVAGLYYILSKAISYTVGAIVSYLLNRKWTFNTNKSIISIKLPKFLAVNAVSITLSLTSMYLIGDVLGWHIWIAYFGSILFSFSSNFLGNRFWVFRKDSQQS